MTRLSRIGTGSPCAARTGGWSTARAWRMRACLRALAQPLLLLLVALSSTGCLPPDFEIAPRENHPVTIDKSLLTRSPDQFQDLTDCKARQFDVKNAIVDPDEGDPVQTAWIIDYAPGSNLEPDVNNQFRFTYTPCITARAVENKVQTVEVLVFDRPLPPGLTVDELKAFNEDDVTSDSVVWFVRYDGTCCDDL